MGDFNQIKGEIYGGNKFLIRPILPSEIEEVFYNLIDKQNWNITLCKVKALCGVFPSDIFVTIQTETKEVVAVVTIISTHPKQYVVGNLVVREDFRNRGHGTRITRHVMNKHTHDTLTLTAVPGAHTFYSKIGFQVTEPTHHVYYLQINRERVHKSYSHSESQIEVDNISIELYSPKMLEALKSYDRNVRGYDCGKYLSIMTRTSDHFLVATSRTSGHVVGYAAGVDQVDLLWIDGMYADTDTIALSIFRKMHEAYPHKEEIRIQTIKAREFLIQFGDPLPKTCTYTRMSTGPPTNASLSRLYAVADCDYAE